MNSEVVEVCCCESLWQLRKDWWVFEFPEVIYEQFQNVFNFELRLKGSSLESQMTCCSKNETFGITTEKWDQKYYFLFRNCSDTQNDECDVSSPPLELLASESKGLQGAVGGRKEDFDDRRLVQSRAGVALVGETQKSFCLTRIAPRLHQVDSFLDAPCHEDLYLDFVDILGATQASADELQTFLLEGFYLCSPNLPNVPPRVADICTADDCINGPSERGHLGFWRAVKIEDILNCMKLLLAQMAVECVSPVLLSLQMATRLLTTAVTETGHQFSFRLELNHVFVIQIVRFFADISTHDSATNALLKSLDSTQKYETYISFMRHLANDQCQITLCSQNYSENQSLNIAASTTAETGRDPSDVASDILLTVNPTKVLRVIQLFVLQQKQQLPLLIYAALCTDMYHDMTPAELLDPFPSDFEEREDTIFSRAGMCGLFANEIPRDPKDGSFDIFFGFAGLRNFQGEWSSSYGVLLPGLIGGFGYACVNRNDVAAAYVNWMPHFTMPWDWRPRIKKLLSLEDEWYEEDLSVYLSSTLVSSGSQTIESILASNFVRLTKEAPFLVANIRIQSDGS